MASDDESSDREDQKPHQKRPRASKLPPKPLGGSALPVVRKAPKAHKAAEVPTAAKALKAPQPKALKAVEAPAAAKALKAAQAAQSVPRPRKAPLEHKLPPKESKPPASRESQVSLVLPASLAHPSQAAGSDPQLSADDGYYRGVYKTFSKAGVAYDAKLTVKGRLISAGTFSCREDAARAWCVLNSRATHSPTARG